LAIFRFWRDWEDGELAVRRGIEGTGVRWHAGAQAGFRAADRISFASFRRFKAVAARSNSPRARWTSQPEPVEAQDALQVREQHFDLLPFTARSDISTGARLNVMTFTFSGIAATVPVIAGEQYQMLPDAPTCPCFGNQFSSSKPG
jgi:hypothetical protein